MTFPFKDLSTFSELILGLASVALEFLGESLDPDTKKSSRKTPNTSPSKKNLKLAKQNIDFIEILSTKTKGNLTSQEKKILSGVLEDLRSRYAAQMKEG